VLGLVAASMVLWASARHAGEEPKRGGSAIDIDDDVLETFAVVGTHAEVAEKLLQRFGDVVTSCEFSIAVRNQRDKERLAQIVKDVHSHPPDIGRQQRRSPSRERCGMALW